MPNVTAPTANDRAAAARLAGLPASAAQLVGVAAAALPQRQATQAENALRTALTIAPGHPEILRLLAIALRLQNRNGEALPLLRQAAAQRADDALIQNGLGTALDEAGDGDGAIAAFRRACELAPQAAPAWSNLGKAFSDRERFEEAVPALERALQIAPHDASHLRLAQCLRVLGRTDESAARYRELIARNPADGTAWLGLAMMKTRPFAFEDIGAIEAALHTPVSADDRISLGFAHAKALDDHGCYAAAFAALVDANARTRAIRPWSAQEFSAIADAVLAAFAQAPAGAPNAQGDEVIFIVSLPRAGSSLTEQILASHPLIEGGGELDALTAVVQDESKRCGLAFPQWVASTTRADWQRLGADYLQRTARWRKPGTRFTDKLPGNWMRVGAALAMLPGARVVDCRRDPVESCFSCFRTLFIQGTQAFSYDLDDLAAYWRDYDRVSRHWASLYPNRFRVQQYEALVADAQAQTRELLDFCGVAFDPACLRFHETRRSVVTASASQVREPIRRQPTYADKYGALLDPLRAQLACKPVPTG